MNHDIVLVVFALWVFFQIWKGFREGFWLTALSLLGLVLAYLATFFLGARLSQLVADLGFEHEYRAFIVLPLLFFAVSIAVQRLPTLFFPRLRQRTGWSIGGGVALGACSGIFSGLIGIWFLGLVVASLDAKHADQQNNLSAGREHERGDPLIERLAGKMVAKSAEFGLKLSGSSDLQAEISAQAIQNPNEVMRNLHIAMSSKEMQALMQNVSIQKMMTTNDVGSLKSSAEFKDVMRVPSMQNLSALLEKGGKTRAEVEQFVSEQLSFVWRRLQYLKHDPRVQDALKDEQVQNYLREKNFAGLLMNAKFQSLVSLVMDKQSDMNETDFSVLLEESRVDSVYADLPETPLEVSKDNQAYSPSEVYKWRDTKGNLRYTDKDQVPEHLLEHAEKLIR